MSYLAWTLSNPLDLVIFPPISIIIFQLITYNLGRSYNDFTLEPLKFGTSWLLPFTIFMVTLYISFINKIYILIQENCDMKLIKLLEASINGQSRRIQIDQEKRDAEYKDDQERREQEIKDLITELQNIKLSQVKLENKIDK